MTYAVRFALAALFIGGCSTGSDPYGLPDARFGDAGTPDGALDAGAPRDGAVPDAATSPEECDGLDDDGDGAIDEGCFCVPGETQSCFGGPASARAVGVCADGSQTCQDALEFGTWGACEGDTRPGDEACDGTTDEDCDGAVDEGCACSPGAPPSPCGSDEGACEAGSQECLDGMLGECLGAVGPGTERCNAIDDDCDASTDESLTRRCGSDVGECTRGAQVCVDGAWDACTGGRTAGTEDCNGLDDDCDGSTDEALMRACGSAVGECSAGMQTCATGAWSTCTGGTMPAVETCNSSDDDCDGTSDESVTRACGSAVGICRPGTQTCTAGSFGTCTGGVRAGTEVCDGTRDEDCDGTVDEGCTCTTGMTMPCGTDTGECVRGSQTCNATGMWGACTGSTGPVAETCNTRDDDCDGATDEGGICPTSPPSITCGGGITAQVLSTVTVSGTGSDPDGGPVTYAWTVTSRPPGSTAMPGSPTSASTSFFLDASGTFTLRLCVTDDEGETSCCTVTITSTPPGILQVELAWSNPWGDVDLHLLNVTRTPPAGWWTVDDCHYANPTPDWAPVGANANPTLDRDDRDGFGPENISIDTAPASGTYNIGVHYYCDASPGGSGPTTATVRVYCMGALIATYSGITVSETDDWVNVARVTWPGCAGMSINTRTNGTSLLPASATAPRHCEISCTTDSDCPTGERCVRVGGGGPPRYACFL